MEKDTDIADIHERLALLRKPFPDHQIGKLPRGTKVQNACPASEKVNCKICGGWHHPRIVHLDYVGHAATTDRILDADPAWSWEPMAYSDGLPKFDANGGLWIKLTVCGVTRIGYGNASTSDTKEIGSREKEVIGDAIRNAAMRFGCGLDLWHKGDLHIEDDMEGKTIDSETGEVITKKGVKKETPAYTDAQFAANKPVWQRYIDGGAATPEMIIARVSGDYILKKEHKEIIQAMKKTEQATKNLEEGYAE